VSYIPLPFEAFGGAATRWTPEKLPPSFAARARNVDFVGGVVRSGAGLTTAFTGPSSTVPINGIGQFSLIDGTKLVVAFDAAGNFFVENPAGSGAVSTVSATGYGSQHMIGEAAQGRWFFATSDLRTGSIVPKVYHKYSVDNKFYLDSVGLAANTTPCAGVISSDAI